MLPLSERLEQANTNRTNRSHVRCHPYPIPQPDHTTWPHHPGLHPLIFFRTVVWILLHPTWTDQWKCCETGPTIFLPYPRRQNNLTICRCHYKGSTKLIFSVVYRPWVLFRPGFEPATSHSADQHSPNWANQVAVYFSTLSELFLSFFFSNILKNGDHLESSQ